MEKPTLQGAKRLLEALTERFPPPAGEQHSLTLNQEGGLDLAIHVANHWRIWRLDDKDLTRDAGEIVDMVASSVQIYSP